MDEIERFAFDVVEELTARGVLRAVIWPGDGCLCRRDFERLQGSVRALARLRSSIGAPASTRRSSSFRWP